MIINLVTTRTSSAPKLQRRQEAAADMLEHHLIDDITVNIAIIRRTRGTTLSSQNVPVEAGATTNGAGFDLTRR